ncbi:hypothetical protein KIW84_011184 [Lathyrus oleraceus]|uniref:Uncharacterized protein n=1 Tax=Pisum sativum TaxID=3888 RepID=A0A9D4YM15_PEA|nr:hypothetical protein KIW84_011184 [Pisum sativum]
MMKKAIKAWNHISCKGKEFFGKKDYVAYPPYADWIKERIRTILLPFPTENPLYPQDPDHPDFVPREYFNQTLLLSKKLKQEMEDLSMQVFSSRQEKMDLAHKLREKDELLGEYGLAVGGRVRKKTKVNRVKEDTSTVLKNKRWLLKRLRKKSSKSIKSMSHSKSPKPRWRREDRVEIQLKGSTINLEKYVGEIASLKAQLREKDDTPLQIQLPECNECEKLIDQCRYLDGIISRKYVVIQNLVQNHNLEGTKNMFEESKAWSLKYLKSGGALTYVDWKI